MHAHPELSGQEWATSRYLQQQLQELGWETCPVSASSPSFLAYCSGACVPAWGLRAELDALPVHEATGLPFASQCDGVMHACGHDMHMAIACGMAALASAVGAANMPLLVFESSEEKLPGGAQAILSSEHFDSLRPRHMLAFHCDPSLPVGQIGFHEGAFMSSGDEVNITVRGRGGHAALPHQLIDPVVASAHVMLALQTIHSRSVSPFVPSLLSFGNVICHGAHNLIPDEVRLEGTLRTHSEEWRAQAKVLIRQIACASAESLGAKAEVDIADGYPVLYNDPQYMQCIRACVQTVERVTCVDVPQRMTTDDFAYFAQSLPSAYLRLGVGDAGALHAADFCPDEGALRVALQALIAVAKGVRRPDGS